MLEEERQSIDCIDKDLVRLFEARMQVVTEIARKKQAAGLPVRDSSRETQVLDKVESYLKNPDYAPYLRKFYQELMAASRAYQEDLLG